MTEIQNQAIAESLQYFDRTVAVLDCGCDDALLSAIRRAGFYAYKIPLETFCRAQSARIGSVTVIPDGAALPADTAAAVHRYMTQNGSLLILGGPLFGIGDAASGTANDVSDGSFRLVLEGVSPSYKIYREDGCDRFATPAQPITNAVLTTDQPVSVICPAARPDGAGYDNERINRMASLAEVRKDGELRGIAAFLLLSDTTGHLTMTNGSRPGTVSCVTRGSAAGVVGMSWQTLQTMGGGETLVCDILRALVRGIFLYEGGVDSYVCRPGDELTLGAKLLTTARDFLDAAVKITLRQGDNAVMEDTFDLLATPQNFTRASVRRSAPAEGCYTVTTELLYDGQVIDRIDSELTVTQPNISDDPADFVSTSGSRFTLGGEDWEMRGINYWPLYHVSLEHNQYWIGAFDKSNYIPAAVERDLTILEKCGFNSLAIRVDGNDLARVTQPVRDFMERCRRHGLRVMVSFCNASDPLFFQQKAYERFLRDCWLIGNPTMFAHDIAWEVGPQFFGEVFRCQFNDRWADWLVEQYGSIEAAESALGTPIDRDAAGNVTAPARSGFRHEKGSGIPKYVAYRHFMYDLASRTWNKACRAIRTLDPHHLITTRAASSNEDIPNVMVEGVGKHLDFIGLEAYTIEMNETGFAASAALMSAASHLSGGKPVTWVEYGISLVGQSGLATGTPVLWDAENLRPLDKKVQEQADYQAQFCRLFAYTGCAGSMPWFYAGGFRSTEHSDCGYVHPNGTLRPAAEVLIAGWGKDERPSEAVTITVDPDTTAAGWGTIVFGDGFYNRMIIQRLESEGRAVPGGRVDGPGMTAVKQAYPEGKGVIIRTPGTGSTSADAELRWLNAEFNDVQAASVGDMLALTVSVGNTGEAAWLPENVTLSVNGVSLAIPAEVPRFGDVTVTGCVPADGTLVLRMQRGGEGFGEKRVIG